MKHTKGPWFASNPDKNFHFVFVGGATKLAIIPNEPETSEYVIENDEEREANARLMAASPELLVWTKELLHLLKLMAPIEYKNVVNHVQKVINKAEGNES